MEPASVDNSSVISEFVVIPVLEFVPVFVSTCLIALRLRFFSFSSFAIFCNL